MIIAALHEGISETRVAITPNLAKRYLKLGFEVLCEQDAGKAAGFQNEEYQAVGVDIIRDKKTLLQETNILLGVNEPLIDELKKLNPESLLITHAVKSDQNQLINHCLKHRISVFSMNHIPRISRAQQMDSLSSQANLAGYQAILEATHHFKRMLPMMMTAAGMISPAKILVLGAGVAGLQAIATAKRLGAVVHAFDVRQTVKEQVESLGAEFIEVQYKHSMEDKSGYALEMCDDYQHAQTELIERYAKRSDIVICTAQVFGKNAPLLLKESTVKQMKPGSVIIDMATSSGGNCELSELNLIVYEGEITIVGYSHLERLVPATASDMYANNLLHVVQYLTKDNRQTLTFNEDDEIIQQSLLCYDGQYLPFQFIKES